MSVFSLSLHRLLRDVSFQLPHVALGGFSPFANAASAFMMPIRIKSWGKWLTLFSYHSCQQYTFWGLTFPGPPSSLCVQCISADGHHVKFLPKWKIRLSFEAYETKHIFKYTAQNSQLNLRESHDSIPPDPQTKDVNSIFIPHSKY